LAKKKKKNLRKDLTKQKKCDRIGELVVEQIENRESKKKEVKRNVLFCLVW